jgi:hypothetical protein
MALGRGNVVVALSAVDGSRPAMRFGGMDGEHGVWSCDQAKQSNFLQKFTALRAPDRRHPQRR